MVERTRAIRQVLFGAVWLFPQLDKDMLTGTKKTPLVRLLCGRGDGENT
jgi:hypothetical protein